MFAFAIQCMLVADHPGRVVGSNGALITASSIVLVWCFGWTSSTEPVNVQKMLVSVPRNWAFITLGLMRLSSTPLKNIWTKADHVPTHHNTFHSVDGIHNDGSSHFSPLFLLIRKRTSQTSLTVWDMVAPPFSASDGPPHPQASSCECIQQNIQCIINRFSLVFQPKSTECRNGMQFWEKTNSSCCSTCPIPWRLGPVLKVTTTSEG